MNSVKRPVDNREISQEIAGWNSLIVGVDCQSYVQYYMVKARRRFECKQHSLEEERWGKKGQIIKLKRTASQAFVDGCHGDKDVL